MHASRANRIEAASNARVCTMPEHLHVLREDVLTQGVTLSRLYDESLHKYWASDIRKPLTRDNLVTVMLAVAKALSHLHTHDTGHFDVKPSNVLIKWSHARGVFEGTMIVLADFGLCHELKNGSYSITHTVTTHNAYVHTCHDPDNNNPKRNR